MAKTRCSFCGRHEHQVRHLIAGPGQVAICNECVDLCVDVQSSGMEFDGHLLLTGIGELTTNDRFVPGLTGVIRDAAVAVRGGVVRWVGPQLALPDRYRSFPTVDCGGRAVLPGFVDAHTHALFGGEQAHLAQVGASDIEQRAQGAVAAATTTRATSSERLFEEVSERLARMLAHGTTTVEVKSGYGSDLAGEHRLLDLADRLDRELSIDVVTTLLFGMAPPSGMSSHEYAVWASEELVVACAPQASYADVALDHLAPDQVGLILDSAVRHGLSVRAHVAGAGSAIYLPELLRHGPVTLDHLDHLHPDDLSRLGEAGVVAVLLPTTGGPRGAGFSAPAMWDAGLTVALGTDCNPVDSYVESMQFVVALAVTDLGMSVEQAVWSATRGGALAVQEPEKGWLGRGTFGDLLVLDAPSAAHLAYRPGINLAWRVFKEGIPVAGL